MSKKAKTFEEVVKSVTTEDGAIDLMALQRLEGSCGYNGGRGCDVFLGPCSCGAWHTEAEDREGVLRGGEGK